MKLAPTTLALAALLAAPASALAAQTTPASDFAGVYSLETTSAAVAIHVGLAAVNSRGGGSWGDVIGVQLDADGIDAAEAQVIEDELYASCEATPIPDAACSSAAAAITDAVVAFNNQALDLIPYELRLAVGSFGWVSALFGLYPAPGYHYAAAGEFPLTYLLNNVDGPHHGDLLSGALALNGGGGGPGWICGDVGAAVVAGNIDQPAGFKLDAEFAADRELFCAANAGGTILAGTIGLTFAGAVEGSK